MTKKNQISPLPLELPTDFADRMGVYYTSIVTKQHKKQNGQFFTPSAIARFMTSLTNPIEGNIKILDPGCGTAILSCALVERLIENTSVPKQIELTVYETDESIIPFTLDALTYLKKWALERKIIFFFELVKEDFILQNANVLQEENQPTLFKEQNHKKYDFVISNPPYFKLSKEDTRTKASEKIVSGQPNIYALFMAVAAKLLREDGQFIFITPRSFASGNYFNAFRNFFFKHIQIQQIHLFVSRRETFNRDNVLQETLILKGLHKNSPDPSKEIVISSSQGLIDINYSDLKKYNALELIDFSSKEKILHLPTNDFQESIFNLFKSWKHTLEDFNIKISTGPVVAFRASEFIQEIYSNETICLAPLFWLHNVTPMAIKWPVHKSGKGQYIKISENSKSILIPNKNYIFLRRFSSKDDKRRLIAAPYYLAPTENEYIGIENKLNYIYRYKGNLDRTEVAGLAGLLNSTLFDTYFRTFNGNVNVSATELRKMPMPPLDIIKQIGNQIITEKNLSETRIDEIVMQHFEIKHILTA